VEGIIYLTGIVNPPYAADLGGALTIVTVDN